MDRNIIIPLPMGSVTTVMLGGSQILIIKYIPEHISLREETVAEKGLPVSSDPMKVNWSSRLTFRLYLGDSLAMS